MDQGRLLSDIKEAEGFRTEAYKDTRGIWTSGYGHELFPQSRDWTGEKFTLDTINNWLLNDTNTAWARAKLFPEYGALDTNARQNALVELVFNMGPGTWRQFVHTRDAMAHKQWQAAYDGLLASAWAREVQPNGFTKPGRATRIATYILRGAFT